MSTPTTPPGCIDPEDLSALLDGELAAARAAAVRAHLDACARCSALSSRLHATSRLTASLPREVADEALVQRIAAAARAGAASGGAAAPGGAAALDHGSGASAPGGGLFRGRWMRLAAAAAAVLGAVLVFRVSDQVPLEAPGMSVAREQARVEAEWSAEPPGPVPAADAPPARETLLAAEAPEADEAARFRQAEDLHDSMVLRRQDAAPLPAETAFAKDAPAAARPQAGLDARADAPMPQRDEGFAPEPPRAVANSVSGGLSLPVPASAESVVGATLGAAAGGIVGGRDDRDASDDRPLDASVDHLPMAEVIAAPPDSGGAEKSAAARAARNAAESKEEQRARKRRAAAPGRETDTSAPAAARASAAPPAPASPPALAREEAAAKASAPGQAPLAESPCTRSRRKSDDRPVDPVPGLVPATVIDAPAPILLPAAEGRSAAVILRAIVERDGSVSPCTVEGAATEEEAEGIRRHVLSLWRYSPALLRDRPQAAWIMVRLERAPG